MRNLKTTENPTIQELDDHSLVEVARTGNREAFGELVKRYRNQALNWAQMLVRDTNLAEDIVQEALIQAFLQLGKLVDIQRFSPWFKKIVHNQALMKLRHSRFYQEELFTHIENKYSNYMTFDVHNVEHILHYLTQNVSNKIQYYNGDPEALILKKEMLVGIRELLYCLSKREREIFEAYFFEQITPSEIAELFGLSIGNIYTTLSRSRVKVRRERTRIYLNNYFRKGLENGFTKKKILTKPLHI